MTFRAAILAACLGGLALPARADGADGDIVLQCLFGEGLDLALIVPGDADLSAGELDLVAVPGQMGERPAVARFTPFEEAPIGIDHAVALFALEDGLGAAAMLAENGDALLRLVESGTGSPTGQPDRLGECDNADALFAGRD